MSEEGKEGYDSADSNDLEPKRDPTDQANRHEGLEQWLRPETPPEVADRLRQLEIVSVERSISHAGPLPPASEFKGYEDVLPGAADRILSLAEKEQSIRSKQSEETASISKHRINAATVISLAVICLGGLGFYLGYEWQGVPLGLGGLVTLFLREILSAAKSRTSRRIQSETSRD